ncbi:MAG: hypothetical protein ACFFG0_30270 [Candidatus Thorarchaeota archaeon]
MSYLKLRLPYFNETQKSLYKIYIRNEDIVGLDGLFNQVISKILESIILDLENLEELIDTKFYLNVQHNLKMHLEKYKEHYDLI